MSSDAADALLDCQHDETAIRRRVLRNFTIAIQHQCLTCGESIGPCIAHSKVKGKDVGTWDEELEHRVAEARRLRAEAGLLRREQERTQWRKDYAGYLLTPAWRARRALVLARAQSICEGCRKAQATEVHHTTYAHATEEFLFELVALCAACHRRVHGHEHGDGGAA